MFHCENIYHNSPVSSLLDSSAVSFCLFVCFCFLLFANTENLKMVFKRKQVLLLRQMKYTMRQTVMIC